MTTPSSSTTPNSTRNPTQTATERFAPHSASMMKPPDGGDEDAEEDDGRDPPTLETEVEHDEHDEQADRNEDASFAWWRGPDSRTGRSIPSNSRPAA